MMKVIYDISVLGMAYYQLRARTGIARVIENVAVGLKMSVDCDLSFCAYYLLQNLIQGKRYLQAMPELRDVPMISLSNDTLNYFMSSFERFYPHPSRKIADRIIWRAFAFLLHRFDSIYNSIDERALQQADIFHGTFYPIPAFIRRYPKVRNFITIYDLIPILYPQYFLFKEDHLLHDVMQSITPDDWVIAISQSTKDDLCDYLKFDPARVFVTHLAASDLFHPCADPDALAQVRTKYRIPDGPYVLSLCTFEPRKNIDYTIRSFARMVKELSIPDLNLVLVGTKGWNFDRIFGEISNHDQFRDRIVVTGYMADEDLAAIYSGAQMFVYPSFYEGFGLPPLEAMQCGVPVITSNTSSLPEVVGDAGIMVAPTDTDALCQAMYDIYRRPSLRDDLSKKSLERASRFSWQKCTQETINAYKTALKS